MHRLSASCCAWKVLYIEINLDDLGYQGIEELSGVGMCKVMPDSAYLLKFEGCPHFTGRQGVLPAASKQSVTLLMPAVLSR